MIYLCGIVAVDTDRRIVKRGQQVLPDIADLGGVLFEAVKDKADMLRIELQKPGLHDLCREIAASDADMAAGGTDGIGHQTDDFFQAFLFVWHFLQENIIVDIFFN